jgi:hypothetical protein
MIQGYHYELVLTSTDQMLGRIHRKRQDLADFTTTDENGDQIIMDHKVGTVAYALRQYNEACRLLNVRPAREGEPSLAEVVELTIKKLGEAANQLEEYVKAEAQGDDPMKIEPRATDAGDVPAGKTLVAPNLKIAFKRTEEGYCTVSHVFDYPIDVLEKLIPALPTPEECDGKEVYVEDNVKPVLRESGTIFVSTVTLTPKLTSNQLRLKEVRDHIEKLKCDLNHRKHARKSLGRLEESIRLFQNYEELLKSKEDQNDG